jgi:TLC domain
MAQQVGIVHHGCARTGQRCVALCMLRLERRILDCFRARRARLEASPIHYVNGERESSLLPPTGSTIMVEPKRRLRSHQSKVLDAIPSVLIMVGMQHACYLLCRMAFEQGWTSLVGLSPMSNETCQKEQDNKRCGRSDLFGFQCVSELLFLICGLYGFYVFHLDRSLPQKTIHDRLFGYHPLAEEITKINLAYQIWDILISLTIPENYEWIMMSHHVVAAFLCYSALSNNMLGYYATFFLGISEVSSIFLVLLDCAKYFEPTTVGFPMVKLVSLAAGIMFFITFAAYRVVLWWPTSIQLFRDVFQTTSGTPSQMMALRTWLVFNIPMGCLQLYWLGIILSKAQSFITKTHT